MNHDINVQFIRLPSRIQAMVTANEDDSYTIFLNKNHSYETLRSAAEHELRHIQNGDLHNKELTADELEMRCHNQEEAK